MPFDAVSTGCAVELSQKCHMTKTDTHILRHRCPITTRPRVGALRIAVGYYATKNSSGTYTRPSLGTQAGLPRLCGPLFSRARAECNCVWANSAIKTGKAWVPRLHQAFSSVEKAWFREAMSSLSSDRRYVDGWSE